MSEQVDEGLEEIPGCAPETHTKGLGTLDANCANYYAQGARFAKWRAALRVGPGMPSVHAAQVNAEELASYASVCQARGLCPIVEPEVLIEGDHSAERFAEASQVRAVQGPACESGALVWELGQGGASWPCQVQPVRYWQRPHLRRW